MKVTQEKLPASQIGLQIEIPGDKTQKTYEKVLQNLARSTNIPGFRKGKVPRPILLQRLGSQRVKAAVLEELIQESLEQAISQESIESLGNYQLRSNFEELVQQYIPGQNLTFSASVDVPPVVTLGQYQGLSIKAEEVVYDSSQVDQVIEDYRVKQATLVPVEDRAAQMGDLAVVDYKAHFADSEDKETIPGVEATDFQMELSDGRFVEGLVEGVIGMKPEESKEITVNFPEDYGMENLAGKTVVFTITVKELKQRELPETDDDFAQEVSKFETFAELREFLEKDYQERAAKSTKNNIQSAMITELGKHNSVEPPESMIREEVQAIITQNAVQMSNYGIDIKKMLTPELVDRMRQEARPDAIQRLSHTLILKEIAKTEDLQPEESAIASRIEEVRQEFKDQAVDEARLREMVIEELTMEKTLDWLQERNAIELVPEGSLKPEAETETESAAE